MAAYLVLVRWPFVALGEQSHLPLAQFLIGASLIAVVYPFTFAFISMYVKCMHPMYHEEKAKWLLAGGTLSRMVWNYFRSVASLSPLTRAFCSLVRYGRVTLSTTATICTDTDLSC
jgi:hypothetical protein